MSCHSQLAVATTTSPIYIIYVLCTYVSISIFFSRVGEYIFYSCADPLVSPLSQSLLYWICHYGVFQVFPSDKRLGLKRV